jgi:hypothetical protein
LVICPSCPAPFAKIFPFRPDPNHFTNPAIPSHTEGRFAIVTDVGAGCGGRDSVRRANSARTNDAFADGEVVWS